LGYPLSVFWGRDFLQSNYRKKEKYKIIEERFETKTFQKKTYFFQESQPRKKERKKEKNLPDTVF